MFRQGDVLIVAVSSLPVKVASVPRENGNVILAYGEATGHAHAIMDDDVELFVADGGTAQSVDRWLRVGMKGCVVQHAEHGVIALPPGNYRVVHQREYTPQEIRMVAD